MATHGSPSRSVSIPSERAPEHSAHRRQDLRKVHVRKGRNVTSKWRNALVPPDDARRKRTERSAGRAWERNGGIILFLTFARLPSPVSSPRKGTISTRIVSALRSLETHVLRRVDHFCTPSAQVTPQIIRHRPRCSCERDEDRSNRLGDRHGRAVRQGRVVVSLKDAASSVSLRAPVLLVAGLHKRARW